MNKEDLFNFYKMFFNEHNVNVAQKYVREEYIQHNPGLPSGRISLIETFRKKFEQEKDFYLDIKHILQDEDMFVVHANNIGKDGKIKCKVVDIYRVENGKLVEHWDVIQKL